MSLIKVKVIPRSKQNSVTEGDGLFVVRVTAPAEDGRANLAVRKLLAEHWHIAMSRVAITRGQRSRLKMVEVA